MITLEQFSGIYPKLRPIIGDTDLQVYLNVAHAWSEIELTGVTIIVAASRVRAEAAHAISKWAEEKQLIMSQDALKKAKDGDLEGERDVREALKWLNEAVMKYASLAGQEIAYANGNSAAGRQMAVGQAR